MGSPNLGRPPPAGDSIRRHSRSFSFACRLLPAGKRADVERLYAWCRWCDDGVDAAASPAEAVEFVASATQDVRLIAAGRRPVAAESLWLADLAARHDLPLGAALALLEGMRSDLSPAAGFHEDDLLRYGFAVAGTVGVLMCPILGLEDRRHLPHAAALGMGMQLTNIARDVAEDWRRSRCYLPVEWTEGLRPGDGAPDPERVRQGVRTILELADGYYLAGEAGIQGLSADSRLAVRAAARIYRAIGTEIRDRHFRVLEGRARVSTFRKLLLFVDAVVAPSGGRGSRLDEPAQRALAKADELLAECGVRGDGWAIIARGAPTRYDAERGQAFRRSRSSPETIRSLVMKWSAWSVAFTGLSLTSVMAVVLFALVAINPKDPVYGATPLYYAAASALSATAFNRAAAWAARRATRLDP